MSIYKNKYSCLLPELPERSRRLVVAADALSYGYGGITFIHKASGISRVTIKKGIDELKEGVSLPEDRNRLYGGGRNKIIENDPEILDALHHMVADSAQGDPESPLQWTHKSTRKLAKQLTVNKHPISHAKVGSLLRDSGYRLQANKKNKEGTDHPDRDEQFGHIAQKAKKYIQSGDPVISVDTKKKELVGNFKNNGQIWRPIGKPIEVNMHDFPDKELGKAVPYGIYDLAGNQGYVNVGINHDTGEFAVQSIRRWWENLGKKKYRQSKRLLVTADSGGSNGYRLRLWKKELQKFADEQKLEITVCHFPPGTSKWNKIEHRLFSFISTNWKGKPLTSYQVIVDLIANTKTNTGLRVYAALDENTYELRQKITDKEMKLLNLMPDDFHGEWNYTIKPRYS